MNINTDWGGEIDDTPSFISSVSDESLAKFKAIYKDKVGIDLSDDDVREKALRLLRMVQAVYSGPRLTPEQLEEYERKRIAEEVRNILPRMHEARVNANWERLVTGCKGWERYIRPLYDRSQKLKIEWRLDEASRRRLNNTPFQQSLF